MNKQKYLTDEEREHLEQSLKARLDHDLRNACLFLMALHTGGRAQEVLNLTWNDIELKSGEVFISTLKRGIDRTIPVPKYLRLALFRLREISPSKPFAISYDRMYQLWEKYRPCEKPIKSLRHTFAIKMSRGTDDITVTQQAMGHKSITSTMVYAKYVHGTRAIGKALGVK